MKKYPGAVLIVDDEHVVLTSRLILKDYFEKIETLNSPKNLETRLKQQEFDVIQFEASNLKGNSNV